MTTYTIREESGAEETLVVDSDEEAIEAAEEWAGEGDYSDTFAAQRANGYLSSIYVSYWVERDGEHVGSGTARIDPDEPECRPQLDAESEHDTLDHVWTSSEAHGHAGGATSTRRCLLCGLVHTHSGGCAQDPDTGQQGLDGETYRWEEPDVDLDEIDRLYEDAEGSWTGADWEHDLRDPRTGGVVHEDDDYGEVGEPRLCCGNDPEHCYTCAEAAADACASSAHAGAAMDALREGDWEEAGRHAARAADIESDYGEASVWGDWAAAVIAAAEKIEEGGTGA